MAKNLVPDDFETSFQTKMKSG